MQVGKVRVTNSDGSVYRAGTIVRVRAIKDGYYHLEAINTAFGVPKWVQWLRFDSKSMSKTREPNPREAEIARKADRYKPSNEEALVECAKRPKKSREKKQASEPVSGDIAALIAKLAAATDPSDKRKIRAALRKAGHKGGARA